MAGGFQVGPFQTNYQQEGVIPPVVDPGGGWFDEATERRWIEKNLLGIDREKIAAEERRAEEAEAERQALLAKARESIALALDVRRQVQAAREDRRKQLRMAYDAARKVARRWAGEYREARAAARNAEISLRILQRQKAMRDEEEEMAALLTLTLLDEED